MIGVLLIAYIVAGMFISSYYTKFFIAESRESMWDLSEDISTIDAFFIFCVFCIAAVIYPLLVIAHLIGFIVKSLLNKFNP